MRIVLITLDFAPEVGGVQNYLFEIACRLGRLHELVVATPVEGPLPRIPFRRLVVPGTPWAFARALRALNPDRVLVGHAHPRLLVPAALVAPGRYAVFAHGNDFVAAQRRWHRPLFNVLLRRARPLITNSRANAQRLQQLGMPSPVIIHPGTDPVRFSPPPVPPPPPLTLLTVARLVPRKGVDTVIRSLPPLLTGFPALRYRVVGDGPDRRRLENLAEALGVSEHVDFVGRVSEEELPELYRQAHIFVMPAREEEASTEGFGIVYLEASASGLPVVAGRSGGAVDAVRDGETGHLIPPTDSQALVTALRELLNHPERRWQMGQAGRAWVEREMNWNRVARQMIQILGDCKWGERSSSSTTPPL